MRYVEAGAAGYIKKKSFSEFSFYFVLEASALYNFCIQRGNSLIEITFCLRHSINPRKEQTHVRGVGSALFHIGECSVWHGPSSHSEKPVGSEVRHTAVGNQACTVPALETCFLLKLSHPGWRQQTFTAYL